MTNIYSTQSLQINSLCEFARTLGYVPRDVDMIFTRICQSVWKNILLDGFLYQDA
ncbi:hypothetical protein vBVpaMR16F_43 [Vibrio phage vB_VpaM_R16F]|nr:hypothetical protein vBVpaMR16F_43 [Vibrio phage vB_VpaM_R16F]